MTPLFKDRKTIVIYCLAMIGFALLYSVVSGLPTGLRWGSIIAGAIAYGVIFGMTGIILWSVTRYAIPRKSPVAVKAFVATATGILMVGFAMGAETLAVYIYYPGSLTHYAAGLPQRILISFLFFALLYLLLDASAVKDAAVVGQLPDRPDAGAIERISVRNGNKIKIIPLGEIECIKAEGDYVGIMTCEGRWLKEQTMKYFEENLPSAKFIRVHRSYIVNADKISRLERYGNVYRITLRGGESLKVSQTGYKLLKQRLDM